MAYLTIQINTNPNGASPEVGPSVGDLSQILQGTAANGASKPFEVVTAIQNLLDGIKSGTVAASLSVSSSTVAGTVSGQTGGIGPFTVNLK